MNMMCLGDEDTKERPENPETLALQTTVSNLEKGCKYQQKAMYKRVFLFQCYIKKKTINLLYLPRRGISNFLE